MDDRREIFCKLKNVFEELAKNCNIDLAFLYGSWARGYPRIDSDLDVAVCASSFPESKDDQFKLLTDLTLEISEKMNRETSVLLIDKEFDKPLLYYNAIVLGIPIYTKDINQLISLKNEAVFQMEDFSIFGTRWQMELAKKNVEELKNARI